MKQARSYTLAEIASLLDLRLVGDDDCLIHGLSTLAAAGPGQISFLSNPAYSKQLAACQASAVILSEKASEQYSGNRLVSNNPYVSFARATALFDDSNDQASGAIHPSAVIAETAKLGAGVTVDANAVIGEGVLIGENTHIGSGVVIEDNCELGRDTRLHPNVVLYRRARLGDRVVVHAGSVIGADGFGFAFDGERSIKIAQLGGVRLGDDVEVGAASTIDRGALEDTLIGDGVKIDNQVQIGHNCVIGKHTVICGCAALAGSVTVGEYCVFGGGSGAVGHITIADKVQVSAMTLVHKSIETAGTLASGTLASPLTEWKRNALRFQQLDSLSKRLKDLEKRVD